MAQLHFELVEDALHLRLRLFHLLPQLWSPLPYRTSERHDSIRFFTVAGRLPRLQPVLVQRHRHLNNQRDAYQRYHASDRGLFPLALGLREARLRLGSLLPPSAPTKHKTKNAVWLQESLLRMGVRHPLQVLADLDHNLGHLPLRPRATDSVPNRASGDAHFVRDLQGRAGIFQPRTRSLRQHDEHVSDRGPHTRPFAVHGHGRLALLKPVDFLQQYRASVARRLVPRPEPPLLSVRAATDPWHRLFRLPLRSLNPFCHTPSRQKVRNRAVLLEQDQGQEYRHASETGKLFLRTQAQSASLAH